MSVKTKIIVRILGGLGNQLYIYAFARALSLKYNTPVFIETRTGFYNDFYKRKYRLNQFNINLKLCSCFDSLYYPISKRFKKIAHFFYGNALYYNDKNIDNIEDLNQSIYSSKKIFIDGYWQNENFFKEFSELIRNEFQINFKISETNYLIANEMKQQNSVAIHLRRVQYNHLLSIEYYKNSIATMSKKVSNPVFYVFSDDIEWCRENLNFGDFKFITHNKEDEISELWLMSNCKHFIIANSSFSWWGAFLSNNKDKIVLSSQQFLNHE